MLTTTKQMLKKAYAGHYAVPAINTQGGTYDMIRAICMAAEEMHSPIILAHYTATAAYSGHEWFYQTAKWMAEHVNVPVAIHLDHGKSMEECVQMLKIGFTSVMYDGSIFGVEENAKNTNEVIKVCNAVDIPVEAEIGELARLDDQGNLTGSSNKADPDMVKKYLALCQPDSLAISIGNAHGFYKGEVDIDVEILEKCREFTDIPFVLHGCTGMDEKLIRRSLNSGVSKINFGTQIRYQYVKYVEEGIREGVDQGHAWRLSQYASNSLIDDIKKIIVLAGSEGKA
ncbi:class II fructose-bisphosphate aldolase [Anaerocolumna sp. MB42-C2]|uniref:class II fructose-bisphosphate aldolase n=1 Tax=Anaerocolumna sp. MB42-C2 TaxID=3070997 RepID=UPI0027E0FFFE|nr:class II fructose-bisphosphate aldolase [Anaerocolumna sp. MB42-C2]WMJ86614.1 class II fructose-bisphosphate aldolase [Anaerocolumna sp. MB42-C2]